MPIGRRQFLKTSLAAGAAGAAAWPAAGAAARYDAVAASQVVVGRPVSRADKETIGGAPYQHLATRDYPIRPARFSDVRLTDTFWKPKVDINASVTIPLEVHKFVDGEREFGGNILEAAIMSLKTHPDQKLQALVDAQIQKTAASGGRGNNGFEVAATHFNVTGSRDLITRALKAADGLYEEFRTKNPPFSGGERDATNCLALYRVTRDKKHLDLAKHYLDIRGRADSVNRSRHNQSYRHVLEQREAVGHAVNGATLMVSMADVGVLTGSREYFAAAERMWTDAVARKTYITGGVGTTGNEGFGEPYSLPNINAYAETCAVLMFQTLSHRLFLATGDSKYIDVMERGMYNNALSGVSTTGDRFFYVNRLASAGDGRDLRWLRASLECCPPNLVRFLAAMPGYIYAQGPGGAIYVNLFVSSETAFPVNGRPLTLAVESEMPWGGRTKITARAERSVTGAIKLRIPGWARNQPLPGGLYAFADSSTRRTVVSVNGSKVAASPDRFGYVTLSRVWSNGDVIEVEFPMEIQRVVTDARVKENRGKVAITRGPIVFCAEGPDVAGGKALDSRLSTSASLALAASRDFEGVPAIRTELASLSNPAATPSSATLIPYFLWANRGAGEMSVWLPTREYAPGDVGPAGGYIFYVNPDFATDGWRYLEAAPYDQSAGAKWGCFRTAIPGARGSTVGTGQQNTRDILAACTDPTAAAHLCANLKINGVGGWFLPSRDELILLYKNLRATNAVDFGDRNVADNFSYWTSTQNTADMAGHIDFPDAGRPHYDDKDFPRRVRAIRAF